MAFDMVEMKNTVFFQGWTTRHNTIAEMQILIEKSHESIIFPRTGIIKSHRVTLNLVAYTPDLSHAC